MAKIAQVKWSFQIFLGLIPKLIHFFSIVSKEVCIELLLKSDWKQELWESEGLLAEFWFLPAEFQLIRLF